MNLRLSGIPVCRDKYDRFHLYKTILTLANPPIIIDNVPVPRPV